CRKIQGRNVSINDMVSLSCQAAHDVERARRQEANAAWRIPSISESALGVRLVFNLGIDACDNAAVSKTFEKVEADYGRRRRDGNGLHFVAFGCGSQGGEKLAHGRIWGAKTKFLSVRAGAGQGF